MKIVIHPLEDPQSQLQYVVLLAEGTEDLTPLRRLVAIHCSELQGYNLGEPIKEVELKMPRHINESALLGAVQRTVKCSCTRIEPPKYLLLQPIVVSSAASSSIA